MTHATGTRLKCPNCGSESIIVKSSTPELTCCGKPLEPIFTPPASAKS